MIKDSSQSTHTRVRAVVTGAVILDVSHRFVAPKSPADQTQRESLLSRVQIGLNTISPASRRMLTALRKSMLVSFSLSDGYLFEPVNRARLADELGRAALVPYDIKILRGLAKSRFVIEQRRALPRKQYGEIWLGAGAEFIYSITPEILYCLLQLDPDERPRLNTLQNKAAMIAATERGARVVDVQPRLVPGRQQLLTKSETTLVDRVLNWLMKL